MSRESVREHLRVFGLDGRIIVLDVSSATAEMAAEAARCHTSQIAKTISFLVDGRPVLIVAAGNVRVDNQKFKAVFRQKPRMIPGDRVEEYIGHSLGGVCPFAVKPEVAVYLDVSIKSNDRVYPGGGDDHSIVELSVGELEQCSAYKDYVDVCKE